MPMAVCVQPIEEGRGEEPGGGLARCYRGCHVGAVCGCAASRYGAGGVEVTALAAAGGGHGAGGVEVTG